jgi:iron complex transport system substrate-binding protein
MRSLRRTAVLAVTGTLAAGLLGGCGAESPPPAGTASGDGGAQVGTEAFPRTVTHAMGATVIPRQPRRVVALDSPEMDAATLLGVTPVGGTQVDPTIKGFPGYLRDKLAGTAVVGPWDQPSAERIVSLKPDLILSSKARHEKAYARLSQIAPTVLAETPGGPWKDNLHLYAKALGKEREAADALAAYERRARTLGEAIRAKHGGTMPTVSVVRYVEGESTTRLYRKDTFSGVVLADVGVRRPASQDTTGFSLDVGPERVEAAEADYVFTTTYGDPAKSGRSRFESSPLWKTLPAVRAGKVFPVADETWMLGIGVQGAHLVLDDLARAAGVDPAR